MGLVHDDRVVGTQKRIALRLGQEDAIGHQLDARTGLQSVLETHLVAHHLAQGAAHFFGNAFGHAGGRNASRLGVADQARTLSGRARGALPNGQSHLGQLRGLSRAGLAAHDQNLMGLQGLHDLLPPLADGQ